MRIYIIGNDGITLCREPPATVNKGEIAVASREELHAARLSGKRLLALWNALPGVEKQTKVGDRDTLIDQLWTAIEALPDPDQQSKAKRPSKQDAVIAMLQRPAGATVDEVASVMGWQRHTVRGLFSGTLKKKLARPHFMGLGGRLLCRATLSLGRVGVRHGCQHLADWRVYAPLAVAGDRRGDDGGQRHGVVLARHYAVGSRASGAAGTSGRGDR